MPHYLMQCKYSSEGLEGLIKDKASGRKTAISKAIGSLGGYCLNPADVET